MDLAVLFTVGLMSPRCTTPCGPIAVWAIGRRRRRRSYPGRRDSVPRFAPDGKWIAFERNSKELRVIDPATRQEKLLATGTFDAPPFVDMRDFVWSPDSRFAAYWSSMRISEIIHSFGWKGLLYFSVFRLRVMRFDDHSEDWVLENESMWDYQWVTNKALSPH